MIILSTQYCFLAGLTLLIYDYIITFSNEVNVVWKKNKSSSKSE